MPNFKTITVWFAVNKNGFIGVYADEPIRNDKTGKWESKFPFINSTVYPEIVKLAENSKMDWLKEPECLTFKLQLD